MVSTDKTEQLRTLIAEGADKSQRSKSPDGRHTSRSRGKGKSKEQSQDELRDQAFLAEAYRIHNHLASLLSLLQTVRKPYLSLQEPPPLSRTGRRAGHAMADHVRGENDDKERDELERFRSSKYMSDREREEFDLRGRMVLRRCRERVGLLEDEEKARQATLSLAAPTSLLSSLLPSLSSAMASASTSASFGPLITAHRASILWTLNSLLASASGGLSELQEERSKRRAERGRTLGEGAAKEAALMTVKKERNALGGIGGEGSIASLFGLSPPPQPTPSSSSGGGGLGGTAAQPITMGVIPDDEPPIESQLSAAQLQQFESENSTLLSNMQNQLDSVLAAEKSLLEVSALQTELVRHLVQQTELVDRLYDEAVGSVADVGNANVQLKKARERAKDSRLFLLVFLLGASLALLFLDWYA